MLIEIKINGEAAELHDVLRALLNSTAPVTTEVAKPTTNKPINKKAVLAEKVVAGTATVAEIVEHAMTEGAEISNVFVFGEPQTETPVSNPTTEAISFEQFRAAVGAAALVNKEAVKLLLKEFGAAKTSEVDPKHFGTIMQDLTRIK